MLLHSTHELVRLVSLSCLISFSTDLTTVCSLISMCSLMSFQDPGVSTAFVTVTACKLFPTNQPIIYNEIRKLVGEIGENGYE